MVNYAVGILVGCAVGILVGIAITIFNLFLCGYLN